MDETEQEKRIRLLVEARIRSKLSRAFASELELVRADVREMAASQHALIQSATEHLNQRIAQTETNFGLQLRKFTLAPRSAQILQPISLEDVGQVTNEDCFLAETQVQTADHQPSQSLAPALLPGVPSGSGTHPVPSAQANHQSGDDLQNTGDDNQQSGDVFPSTGDAYFLTGGNQRNFENLQINKTGGNLRDVTINPNENLHQTNRTNRPLAVRYPARFTHGDNVLKDDSQFEAWKIRIQHAIEAQNCSAVFRPLDYRPTADDEIFSHSTMQQMKSAVLGYLKSNVQSNYSESIDHLMEPREIMNMLQSLVLRTNPTTFEDNLTQFNTMVFIPQSEDIVEFNTRFNKLKNRLLNSPDRVVLTPGYLRLRYLGTIREVLPLLHQRETNPHSALPKLNLLQLQQQAVNDYRFAAYARTQRRENPTLRENTHKPSRERTFQPRHNRPAAMAITPRLPCNADGKTECFGCGFGEHLRKDCPDPTKICYNCEKPGHLSRSCPLPPTQRTLRYREKERQVSVTRIERKSTIREPAGA